MEIIRIERELKMLKIRRGAEKTHVHELYDAEAAENERIVRCGPQHAEIAGRCGLKHAEMLALQSSAPLAAPQSTGAASTATQSRADQNRKRLNGDTVPPRNVKLSTRKARPKNKIGVEPQNRTIWLMQQELRTMLDRSKPTVAVEAAEIEKQNGVARSMQ